MKNLKLILILMVLTFTIPTSSCTKKDDVKPLTNTKSCDYHNYSYLFVRDISLTEKFDIIVTEDIHSTNQDPYFRTTTYTIEANEIGGGTIQLGPTSTFRCGQLHKTISVNIHNESYTYDESFTLTCNPNDTVRYNIE